MTPRAEPADRRLLPFAVSVAALAFAVGAQSLVQKAPAASIAGFGVAAVLMAASARYATAGDRADAASEASWPPSAFWVLFALATNVCLAAGAGVHRGLHPRITHLTWLTGLLLYVAAAWRGRVEQSDPDPRGPAQTTVIAAGVLVALFAIAVLGWKLTSIPPEVHGDDAEVGLDAISLLERFNLFETGWFWLPRFHALPTAIGLKIFGIDLLGLRFPSFALGVGSVLLLFAVARRLWDFETAVIAGLLLASQRYFIHLSRAGYHYIDTPFLSLLVVWLFLRVWRDGSFAAAVCCGGALGVGVQTYYASRLVPVLLLLTFAGWLTLERGQLLGKRASQLGVIVVAAIGTAAPMAGYFWNHPMDLWQRTAETSVFGAEARAHLADGYGTDSLARILLIQARAAFSLFNATGDNSLQYGYAGPLFEPLGAALFVLGAALALADALRESNLLLLVWIAVPLVAGGVLTIDTPFYPRISGIVPFAVVTAAVALRRIAAMAVAASRSLGESWPRRIGIGVAAVGLAVSISGNLRSYFAVYAPNHRHSPAVEIGYWIRSHGAGKTAYMIGGAPRFYINHGTIRFLSWGYDKRDVVDLDAALRAQPFDPKASVFVVMPAGEPLIPKLSAAVGPVDVETVRNTRGDLAFFGVVPRAAAAGASP